MKGQSVNKVLDLKKELTTFCKWHMKEPFTIEEHKNITLRITRYLSNKK